MPEGHDSRVARIVVDVRQACVDGFLSLVGQHFDAVPFVVKSRLEERKMNRCHRRCEDDVLRLVFFRKDRFVVRIRFDWRIGNLAVIHDEEEGAQADADSTEV